MDGYQDGWMDIKMDGWISRWMDITSDDTDQTHTHDGLEEEEEGFCKSQRQMFYRYINVLYQYK